MNLDDVRTIVQAIGEKDRAQPLLLPGTVSAVYGSGLVDVVMDSDNEGTTIQVSCLFADVNTNDRVMVLFDPPRGVYAVGLIGRVVEAGQIMTAINAVEQDLAYGVGTTNVISITTDTLAFAANRYYELRLNLGIDLDTVDTDPVEIEATLQVPFAPIINASVASFTNRWGTVNGALVGGNVGTLHMNRLIVLANEFSEVVELDIDVTAFGAGEVTLNYELVVLDAGPIFAPTIL